MDSNSVERMHTFNIKENKIQSKMLKTLKHITQCSSTSSFNRNSSVTTQGGNTSKCYYIEENTKLQEKLLTKSYPVLKDLNEKVEIFMNLVQMPIKAREKFLKSTNEGEKLSEILK